MKNLSIRIPDIYWAYLAIIFWGALCFILLNKTSYGIDEGAAKGILLVWSVVDNVVSPIITSGLPDFRLIFLAPGGFLWTGNILAAKISTIIVMSGAVWAIYRWRERSGNSESALLASGLLLISPLMIDQIDTISVAPFLLIAFALGAWSDKIYRDKPLAFGGMYFAQMFVCMISTTLHPVGIAYPIALLLSWQRNPVAKQQYYFYGGIIFSVLFAILLTMGWIHIEWFNNPITSLSSIFFGSSDGIEAGAGRWLTGIGISIILLLVFWKQALNIWSDFLGRTMIIAVAIGLLVGDETWSIIALTLCLFWGFPLLLRTRADASEVSRGKRGITLALLFVISTSFMLVDKAKYQQLQTGQLSPRDSLIKALVEITTDANNGEPKLNSVSQPMLIASQWPGLTMLACRCGAFPLPPPAKDEQALLEMLKSIKYLIFDPRDPKNASLSHNIAIMNAGKVETIALQEGGVIVEIKDPTATRDTK